VVCLSMLRLVGHQVIDEKSLPCLSKEGTASCRDMVVHAQVLADRTAAQTQSGFAEAEQCLSSYIPFIIQYLRQRGGAEAWIERQRQHLVLRVSRPGSFKNHRRYK
jgi:hypothetical protein